MEAAQDSLVWHQLLMQCSLRSCPAGTVVHIAGQPASQALWLLQGQVTVEAGSGHLQSARQQLQANVTRRPNQESQSEGSIFGTEVSSAWRIALCQGADALPGMRMFLRSCKWLLQVIDRCCNAHQASKAPSVSHGAASWLHW